MRRRFENKPETRFGQSLVEVMVAIGIVVLLAISLVTASLVTQKAAFSAKNDTQATKLTQESLEQIRIFRDRNPSGYDGLTSNSDCIVLTTPSTDPSGWNLSSDPSVCPPGGPYGTLITLNNTDFRRYMKIVTDVGNPSKKLIIVVVTWTESGGTRTLTQSTYLSKWQ